MTTAPRAPRAARTRDPEGSKARLLQAATEEFAAHGIAGARIDRIGEAAGVNKALIYSYFGNKDDLFDAVMNTHVRRILDQVPFTAEDLPGYAGRLFDFLTAHPHQLRLASWQRLERGGGRPDPEGVNASVAMKTRAVADAQAAGLVSRRFSPEDVYVFVMALTTAWTPTAPMSLASADEGPDRRGEHRAAVVEAVRVLFGGSPTSTRPADAS